MKRTKESIAGRRVTREEALKDLGDPKTWAKHSANTYAKFRAKPKAK